MNLKQTKIVATIGPSSESREVLKGMIEAGVDVARLNFSHGDYEAMGKIIKNIRELNREMGKHVAILADLQGPKIRIGEMENDVHLEEESEFTLVTENITGNQKEATIRYPEIATDVSPGERILLDDGKIVLEVKNSNNKNRVTTQVIHGGDF